MQRTPSHRLAWRHLRSALGLLNGLGGRRRVQQQRAAVLKDILFMMRFWDWYRQVPPHYLGAQLRRDLVRLLQRRLAGLRGVMPDSEFIQLQDTRLLGLLEPLAERRSGHRRGAEADFIAELRGSTGLCPTPLSTRLGRHLDALQTRLEVDALTREADRACLLGRPHDARLALTQALQALYRAGRVRNGAVIAEAQQLRNQLAAL